MENDDTNSVNSGLKELWLELPSIIYNKQTPYRKEQASPWSCVWEEERMIDGHNTEHLIARKLILQEIRYEPKYYCEKSSARVFTVNKRRLGDDKGFRIFL